MDARKGLGLSRDNPGWLVPVNASYSQQCCREALGNSRPQHLQHPTNLPQAAYISPIACAGEVSHLARVADDTTPKHRL